MKLDKFTFLEAAEALQVNPDAEIVYNQVPESSLVYVTVNNVLKNPEQAKDMLTKFPLITSNGNPIHLSSHPGHQQRFTQDIIIAIYNSGLFGPMYEALNDLKLTVPGAQQSDVDWDIYTNLYYTDMPVPKKVGNYPHIDPYKFIFNIWLSEESYPGTTFYYFETQDGGAEKVYQPESYVYDASQAHIDKFYYDTLHQYQNVGSSPTTPNWIDFRKGDNQWKPYFEIPIKYNTITGYYSNFYHSAALPVDIGTEVRYSLACGYRKDYFGEDLRKVWYNEQQAFLKSTHIKSLIQHKEKYQITKTQYEVPNTKIVDDSIVTPKYTVTDEKAPDNLNSIQRKYSFDEN